MKSVAVAATGELGTSARRLLEAAQALVLGGTHIDVDALEPLAPSRFAEVFAGVPVELRQQLVRGMCIVALVDGPPDASTTAKVRAFAEAAGVDEPALRPLERFAEGQRVLGTLDFLRRSHLRAIVSNAMADGLVAGAKAVLGMRGLVEDPLVAAPFLALEDLPEGTLGRALFDHYRGHGFAFPGEKGGFPEAGVYHDVAHVLGGYGTDPVGELEVGGFIAGFRKQDPFYVALVPLLVFCAQINVTPIPHDDDPGLFAKPGVAERFVLAIQRGGRARVDLSDGFDLWPWVRLPLDEARAQLLLDRVG
jgi:hypothetical protein